MPPGWLLNIMIHTLSKSWYKTNSAAGTSITCVDSLFQYLTANDVFEGKAYGGEGISTTATSNTPPTGKRKVVQLVSSLRYRMKKHPLVN